MTLAGQMARLTKIDPGFGRLHSDDSCWHIGEYTSRGGHEAGETNRWIGNLKKKPTASAKELYWKNEAVKYWARELEEHLNMPNVRDHVTFVPAPCSKPSGHALYDDRMLQVLAALSKRAGPLDVRNLVITTKARDAQHEGDQRQSPDELRDTMEVDMKLLLTPLRPTVIVVDDVFTQGSTFRAMKTVISGLPGVTDVGGLFLARTIWPQPDPSAIFGMVND